MKHVFEIIVLSILFTACSESFQVIDPTAFNTEIADRTDIETGEELIQFYYNYSPDEATPILEIKKRNLDDKSVEITLIHDQLEDDSQRAIKIIMTAALTDKTWFVSALKTNWKCRDGRGHTDWSSELCH